MSYTMKCGDESYKADFNHKNVDLSAEHLCSLNVCVAVPVSCNIPCLMLQPANNEDEKCGRSKRRERIYSHHLPLTR